jgi:drug/metabolite transporter (DMT)-like permease
MSGFAKQDAPLNSPTKQVAMSSASLVTLLLLVDSLHFVFARAFAPYLDPSVSTMYIMGIATIMIGVFGLWHNRLDLKAFQHHFWFFVIIGLLIGVSTLLTYTSVSYVDAGTASMLGKTSVLFSLLLSVFWLRERLNVVQIAGALIAIAGVVLITFQPGDYMRLGSLMIVFATALYALHAAVVKRHGETTSFVTFFFFRLLFTTIVIATFAISRPVSLVPTPDVWILLVLAATVDVVFSRSLYYLALRRLKLSMHAIVLTLSPVAAIVWSYFLFSTFPQPQQLLGGLAVLSGVLLATLNRTDR